MAKTAVLIIVALFVLWFALKGSDKPIVTEIVVPAVSSAVSVPIGPINAKLYEQNKSGEIGTVEISPMNTKTKVVIIMTGKKSAEAQPAHLHLGACPTPGAISYVLNDVANGVSETVLDTTMANLFTEKELAVNVHKSIKEAAIVVSCGDIMR